MTRWEYQYVPPALVVSDRLNQLGAEGWEVAAADPHGGVIVKRPLPEPEPEHAEAARD